ncbi:extracellular catalytic domain type 2 short-chain-length polyhydroxyalkanoate depolymerase [Streptomyces purpureus]|uniref:extracellular catalytic domain type 2 short-chain-length polyhydroxyalkanoate depolymerase n=1 Tax=Streptomyces purpureus TaxID=1951 RepID=UPI000367E7C4|nr:PHB depolymerase family esterase [Streptomyces purpureus]
MRSSPVARFGRLAALLLLVAAGQALPSPAVAAAPAPVAGELRPYNVDRVFSAGVSSGGYMATQLHVAHSQTFDGSAVFASGPYNCAQNDLNRALNACMEVSQDLQLSRLEQTTRDWSARGLIDDVAGLSGDPVYTFSGSADSTVERPVVGALRDYYGRFGARVLHNQATAAGHAWISPLGANSCGVTRSPWMNNCGIDPEREFLGHLLGSVAAPASAPGGRLVQFDQNAYAPGGAAGPISMDDKGFVYTPTACEDGAVCSVVVALHGCKQGYSYQGFGTRFIDQAYLNEYADTNRLIVLYPQAVATATLDNPNGCWNWWGYLGDTSYARHGGRQLDTIVNMVRALGGGGGTPPPGGTTLRSAAAEDGYVKAAGDGTAAAVGILEASYGLALGRGTDGKFNRAVLSFDTSAVPADKKITRAYLTVTRSSGSGDPWASPAGNRLLVDVHQGCLGGCAVEPADWSAPVSAAGAAEVPAFTTGAASSTDLSPAGLAAINRLGTTQIRLRFAQGQTSTAYLFANKDAPVTLTVEYE